MQGHTNLEAMAVSLPPEKVYGLGHGRAAEQKAVRRISRAISWGWMFILLTIRKGLLGDAILLIHVDLFSSNRMRPSRAACWMKGFLFGA